MGKELHKIIPSFEEEPKGVAGDLYFNMSDNQIYIHLNGDWKIIKYGDLDQSIIIRKNREERLSKLLDN